MLYGETLNTNVFYLVVTIKIESKKKRLKSCIVIRSELILSSMFRGNHDGSLINPAR